MGGNDPTPRDVVWAAIIDAGKNGDSFKTSNLRHYMMQHADREEIPSDETVRRVLRSATEMGVVDHKAGSPRYSLSDDFTARRVY